MVHSLRVSFAMVTDEQARQMRKDVLQDAQRGPLLVKYFTDLLKDREERVAREAATRDGMRRLYRLLQGAVQALCQEGQRLRNSEAPARPKPARPNVLPRARD